VLLVDGLVAIFDQVKESSQPIWVSLEAPSGWGKTRVAQEFFKRISAEKQSCPEYWPPSILGAVIGRGEAEGPGDRRKRVFPESFDRKSGAEMDWFWWGISRSSQKGRPAARALLEDLDQLEQHEAGLERAFSALAPKSAKFRESVRRNIGNGVEAGGGDALGAGLSAVGAAIPILGLATFFATKAVGAAKHHVDREREHAAVTRIDATGSDGNEVVKETTLRIGRLARVGLPVVLFVEDFHHADPGLLELLLQLMSERGSVLVITTSWPGELAETDRTDRVSLLEQCPSERCIRVVLDEVSGPIELKALVPVGAGLDLLERDALAGVVLNAFPSTSSDVVGLLCEKYRSPLALEIVCALDRIRGAASNGALKVQASDLTKIPRELSKLYELVWDELPTWAQNAYALATMEIPELVNPEWGFGDDRFDQQLLKEMFEEGALAAGVELTAAQLQEALDVYAWTREVQHGLGGFTEPDQRSVAASYASDRFTDDAMNKFSVVLGQHIVLPDPKGDLPEAIELHRASLLVGLCEGGVIEPNESVLEALLLLGWSLIDTPSGPVEIRRIVELADSLSRSFPPDQPQFLRLRNLSASEHYRAGRHEQALALFSELLNDQTRLLGPDHPDILTTRNNIAVTHHAAGRLEQALTRYAELFEDQIALLGPDHPNTLTTRDSIAWAHHEAGRHEQALALFSELLNDQTRLLGPDHPDTLLTRNNIGSVYHAAGRHEEALTLYVALLEAEILEFGPDHPYTLRTRNEIALAHDAAGRVEQAFALYVELLEDQIRILGPDHPRTLGTRGNIAMSHLVAGRHEQALALFSVLLEDHIRLLGPNHPYTLTTRNNIAGAHHVAGRHEQALAIFSVLLEDHIRLLGPNHPDTLTTRHNIAGEHDAAGRHEQALALFSELLEDRTRLLGSEHPHTRITRSQIEAHNVARHAGPGPS
jgi:tetratricopeptide (TPR) repeat protein